MNTMEFQPLLQSMFPNKSPEVIDNIISIVEENNPDDNFEYKIESMVNLLTETGSNTQQNGDVCLLDEAAGYDPSVILGKKF